MQSSPALTSCVWKPGVAFLGSTLCKEARHTRKPCAASKPLTPHLGGGTRPWLAIPCPRVTESRHSSPATHHLLTSEQNVLGTLMPYTTITAISLPSSFSVSGESCQPLFTICPHCLKDILNCRIKKHNATNKEKSGLPRFVCGLLLELKTHFPRNKGDKWRRQYGSLPGLHPERRFSLWCSKSIVLFYQ